MTISRLRILAEIGTSWFVGRRVDGAGSIILFYRIPSEAVKEAAAITLIQWWLEAKAFYCVLGVRERLLGMNSEGKSVSVIHYIRSVFRQLHPIAPDGADQ